MSACCGGTCGGTETRAGYCRRDRDRAKIAPAAPRCGVDSRALDQSEANAVLAKTASRRASVSGWSYPALMP